MIPAAVNPPVTATAKSKEIAVQQDLQRQIDQVRRHDIAALGDGEVFVRRDATGAVRAVKGSVRLTEAAREIQSVGGNYCVTAAGAERLNQIPGLNVLTPPMVIVDGREMSNPFIERDPVTKVIQAVYVRKVVFGLTPLGNWAAVDYTLFFNVYTYFLQDLQAKVKKYPICGCYGVEGQRPTSVRYAPENWQTTQSGKRFKAEPKPEDFKEADLSRAQLVFFSITPPVGLWVDLSHGEIQEALTQHVQRQKFGDRHAQSICTRNALLKHPAIAAKSLTVTNGTAVVPVYGYRHDLDPRGLNEMSDRISRGEVDPTKIAVERESARADVVDVVVEAQAERDEFGGAASERTPPGDEPGPGPGEDLFSAKDSLIEIVRQGREIVGEACYASACRSVGLAVAADLASLREEKLKELSTAISKEADKPAQPKAQTAGKGTPR